MNKLILPTLLLTLSACAPVQTAVGSLLPKNDPQGGTVRIEDFACTVPGTTDTKPCKRVTVTAGQSAKSGVVLKLYGNAPSVNDSRCVPSNANFVCGLGTLQTYKVVYATGIFSAVYTGTNADGSTFTLTAP